MIVQDKCNVARVKQKSPERKRVSTMCLYSVQVRGITVCGRRVYRTDTGVKVGFQGPTVSLDEACNDLNASKSAYLRESCIEIDRKMSERQQREIEAANVEYDIDAAAVMQRSQNAWQPIETLPESSVIALLDAEKEAQEQDVQDMRDFENN
jgi:hypothetical protein